MEQTKPKLRFKNYDSGWKQKSLDEVGDILNGLTYSPRDISHNGKLVLRSSNIKKGLIDLNDSVYVETTSYNEVKENDILICVRNGSKRLIGKNCLIPKYLEGEAFGAFMIIYRSEHNKFIKQLLSSEKFYKQVHRNLGATINSINNSDIKKFKFYYPSDINEQQKIASILSLIDDKISLLTKKKELLEQYKKGVMQNIFSQEIRFKDDNGNDFPDWEIRKVEDLFEITRGYVLSKKQMSSEKTEKDRYPVYSSQTSNNGVVGYYKEALFQDSITWTTDGANAGEVNFRKGDFYCTNVCGVLLSRDGFANNCISNILNRVTKRYVSYVGNPKLMNNVMGKIKILIPKSTEEQIKISNFLNVLENKLELVESQIDKTKEFKKGLLQQMFV